MVKVEEEEEGVGKNEKGLLLLKDRRTEKYIHFGFKDFKVTSSSSSTFLQFPVILDKC